jgi:uncharacterized tellurite resistance protein B-like protein
MDASTFEKLLLRSAFCCMTSDGKIDKREIDIIKKLEADTPLFKNINFLQEFNYLIKNLVLKGNELYNSFFYQLDRAEFTVEEELILINVLLQTIYADEEIDYTEVNFFKKVRLHLKVSDERILQEYPDISSFLEEDINAEISVEVMINNFFDLQSQKYKNHSPNFSANSLNIKLEKSDTLT